jgi:hypothetical protein
MTEMELCIAVRACAHVCAREGVRRHRRFENFFPGDDNNTVDCAAAGAPGIVGALKQVAVLAPLCTGAPEVEQLFSLLQHSVYRCGSVYWSVCGLFLDYLWLWYRSGFSGGIFPGALLLIRQLLRGRFYLHCTFAGGLSIVFAFFATVVSHVILRGI